MVALEIMALGKALVYTKESSGKEIINDGDDGLLVDPRNVDQLVVDAKAEMLRKGKLTNTELTFKYKAGDKVYDLSEEYESNGTRWLFRRGYACV